MDHCLDDHLDKGRPRPIGTTEFFRRAFCARCGHDTEQANYAHRGGWVCRECCRKVVTQEEFEKQEAAKVKYSAADIWAR